MPFHLPRRRRSLAPDVALLAAAAVVAFVLYTVEALCSTSEAGEERRPHRRSRPREPAGDGWPLEPLDQESP